MGRTRRGIWFIASGLALFALLFFLSEAELLLVPCKLDTRTKVWQIPFPVIQSDGTVQIVKPGLTQNSHDNLRAVVRDDGDIEIIKGEGRNNSDNLSIVLDPDLVANFNKFDFTNLTLYYFHWWAQGNIKIYNTDRGKKKIELYLTSIDMFHKKYFGEYEFFDNTIILSTHSCKRFLFWTTVAASVIAEFSIFIGFLLIVCDIVSALIRRAKRTFAKNVR